MKFKNIICLLPIAAMVFAGCEKKNAVKEFTGLSFDNATFTYDGQPHSISVTGELPAGASVNYGETGNVFTDAGVYSITATVSCKHYVTSNLYAKLTITNADFSDIVFNDLAVIYDGEPHSIAPVVPEKYAGATITYGENGNTFTEIGNYTVSAKVTLANHNEWNGTAKLKIQAAPLMLADFEGLTDSRLGEQFTYSVYNSSWQPPTNATLSIAKNQIIGEGTSTMRMNLFHNGMAYKATKEVGDIKNGKPYSGFAIDTFADDIINGSSIKIQVQIQFKDLPLPEIAIGWSDTYITYTLSADCPKNWTHWEIPFTDSSLSIASGAITLDALKDLGFDYTIEELMPYIDKVSVLGYGNSMGDGQRCLLYVDNIQLINCEERVCQEIVKIKNRNYTIKSSDNTVFKLSLGDENARMETLNLEDNVVFNGDFSFNEKVLTVNVSPDENTEKVTFKLNALYNGTVLEFAENPSGNTAVLEPLSSHINFGEQVFREFIKVDDFESYDSTGQGFDSGNSDRSTPLSGLRAAYYGDMFAGSSGIDGVIDAQWKLLNASGWPDYLELDQTGHNDSKCASFKLHNSNQVRYLSMGLAFGNAQPLGRGTNFSFFVKGSAKQSLKIRVYYVNRITADNQMATSGYCTCMDQIQVTTEWTQVMVSIDSNKLVYGFMITPAIADARLFMDDIQICGDGNPNAKFTIPEMSDGNYFALNANNDIYYLTLSNDLSNATFGKKDEATYDMDVEIHHASITLKDKTNSGSDLTIHGQIVEDNLLTVLSVEGTLAGSFSNGLVNAKFIKYKSINMDFADGGSGEFYANQYWSSRVEGSSSDSSPTNIRNKTDKNGNKIINMYANGSTSRIYTYAPNVSSGPANNFTVDLGNYWSDAAGAIDYKISLVDINEQTIYVAGGAGDSYATIAKDTSQGNYLGTHLDVDFDLTSIIKIQISIKCDAGTAYIYVDNLALNLK